MQQAASQPDRWAGRAADRGGKQISPKDRLIASLIRWHLLGCTSTSVGEWRRVRGVSIRGVEVSPTKRGVISVVTRLLGVVRVNEMKGVER
jgi:hypothetical protein